MLWIFDIFQIKNNWIVLTGKERLTIKDSPNIQIEDQAYPEIQIEDQAHPNIRIKDQAKPYIQIYNQAYPYIQIEDQANPDVWIYNQAHPDILIKDQANPDIQIYDQAYPDIQIEDQANPYIWIKDQARPDIHIKEQAHPNIWIKNQASPRIINDNKTRILFLGHDSRGYARSLSWKDDLGLIFRAGCHTFTIEEARQHWGEVYDGNRDEGDGYLRLLDYCEKEAKTLGWS